MAQRNRNAETTDVKTLLVERPDLIREIVKQTVQQILESEMDEALGARRSERTE
jgi:putative transposase